MFEEMASLNSLWGESSDFDLILAVKRRWRMTANGR